MKEILKGALLFKEECEGKIEVVWRKEDGTQDPEQAIGSTGNTDPPGTETTSKIQKIPTKRRGQKYLGQVPSQTLNRSQTQTQDQKRRGRGVK